MSSCTDRVLTALRNTGCKPTATRDGWRAHCPAHEDSNPSLSVAKGREGCALVHCFAGCGLDDIAAALSLAPSDFFESVGRGTTGGADNGRTHTRPPSIPKQRGIPFGGTTARAARALHDRGFRVLPVPLKQKRPVIEQWPRVRIAEGEIATAFTGPSNIGVLLGEPSGWLVDVDLDDPAAVLLADEYLPPTGCVFGRESKPRSHRVYRVRGDIKTRQLKRPPTSEEQADRLAAGSCTKKAAAPIMVVEIRSTGAQTIAPGSVHPSGEPVEWYDDGEPAEIDAAVLNAAVSALADRVRREYGDAEGGISDEWQPPRPLSLGPVPPPFPMDEAFPPGLSELRDFVVAAAEALQVPIDLPAMLLLPLAGVAIAKKFEIEVRPGWRETPAIWSLCLSESGERKSGTVSVMAQPILDWERDEAQRLGPEIARLQENRKIGEARLAQLRKIAARGGEEAAAARDEARDLAERMAAEPVPKCPMIFSSDATTEGLAGMLVENHERGIVASAEADALDVMMGRYSERSTPNMGIWLKGHAGDPERIVRRSRPPEFLRRPVLNVAMAVQPEAVRGMYASRVARGRGLLARFLASAPTSLVGHRKTGGAARPLPDALRTHYCQTLRRLLDIPIDIERGPVIVRLSAEAAALFHEFEARIESQLGRSGCLGDRRDWGGKLCGAVARIALILRALEQASRNDVVSAAVINEETMWAALSWVPYLIEHERIVAGVAGCDHDTDTADRVLAWLERARVERFSKRDAFQATRSQAVRQVEDLDGGLAMLEEHGFVRRAAVPSSGPAGGRPRSPEFIVNPHLWKGAAR